MCEAPHCLLLLTPGVAAQDVGLLAVPYVSPALSIPPQEEGVVIVASDGLWDVVTPEAAGAAALRMLAAANGSAAAVAEGLMWMALQGRSQDDITVMVLHIQRESA
jgi:serine/threonine protein phosphatase PrpC